MKNENDKHQPSYEWDWDKITQEKIEMIMNNINNTHMDLDKKKPDEKAIDQDVKISE